MKPSTPLFRIFFKNPSWPGAIYVPLEENCSKKLEARRENKVWSSYIKMIYGEICKSFWLWPQYVLRPRLQSTCPCIVNLTFFANNWQVPVCLCLCARGGGGGVNNMHIQSWGRSAQTEMIRICNWQKFSLSERRDKFLQSNSESERKYRILIY